MKNTLTVQGKEWFDHKNGNSYCAVRVYWEDTEVARAPFQYGYGNFYLQAASEALEGWFPPDTVTKYDNSADRPLWQVAQDAGFILDSHIARNQTRRAVEKWGKEPSSREHSHD